MRGKKEGLTISPFTVITAAALTVMGYGVAVLSYAAALILHEFAHAAVSERLGYGLKNIHIAPYGVSIKGDYDYVKPSDEIKIAIAGPAANFVFWLLITGAWWLYPPLYTPTSSIAEAGLFTAVINLLPVYPMDGGRVLHGILLCRFSHKKTCIISRIVAISTAAVAVACAITLIVLGKNYTFATLAVFVIVSAVRENGGGYERIYSMSSRKRRLGGGLKVREIIVSKDVTLLALFSMLKADVYTRFLVSDDSMKVLFVLTETDLERIMPQFNCTDKVISVANSV